MPKLYPGYRDEIRKKIITEAFSVFLVRGFEKTTLEEIAERLGVTKSAIYRYFSNKEDLFLSSTAETMMGEFQKIFAASFFSGDLIDGAGIFFDELLDFHHKYAEIGKDIERIVSRNTALQEDLAGLHAKGLAIMQQFFQDHKEKGIISTGIDDLDLAHICSALAIGLTNTVNTGMEPAEARRLWLLGFASLAGVNNGKKKGGEPVLP